MCYAAPGRSLHRPRIARVFCCPCSATDAGFRPSPSPIEDIAHDTQSARAAAFCLSAGALHAARRGSFSSTGCRALPAATAGQTQISCRSATCAGWQSGRRTANSRMPRLVRNAAMIFIILSSKARLYWKVIRAVRLTRLTIWQEFPE